MTLHDALADTGKLRNPAELREEVAKRDRLLFLRFVELGGSRGARAQIVKETKLPRDVVYRAIRRELKAFIASEAAQSATSEQQESERRSA